MLRLGREKKELRVVNDQTGTPTWCRPIASAAATVANRLLTDETITSDLFHLPAGGTATWYDFACRIFQLKATHAPDPAPKVVPIPTTEYPTPAQRPPYSVLSGEKIARRFDIALPDWSTQLEMAIAELSTVPY
jgi:dTDP-4-dehydrorhamnose reductase